MRHRKLILFAAIREAARRIFDMSNYALLMRLPEPSVAKGAEGGEQ
jgi:hypothetical protein